MRSNSRKKSRNKSSKKRSRSGSKSRSRLASCRNPKSIDTLNIINQISWDVATPPFNARLGGVHYKQLMNTVWCATEMKLLLPIVQSDEQTTMIVYYQEVIRKPKIKIIDVLNTIFRFYNKEKVSPSDLSYISVSTKMRKFSEQHLANYYSDNSSIKSLHFINFLGNQTTYKGLQHQTGSIYSLALK